MLARPVGFPAARSASSISTALSAHGCPRQQVDDPLARAPALEPAHEPAPRARARSTPDRCHLTRQLSRRTGKTRITPRLILIFARVWRHVETASSLAAAAALRHRRASLAGCGAHVDRRSTTAASASSRPRTSGAASPSSSPAHQASVQSIIVNPAQDPHSYEPTADDARTLATAQLAIVNGVGYDPWAPKLLAANPDARPDRAERWRPVRTEGRRQPPPLV